MISNLNALAHGLQRIRKSQGLSREELASLARVSPSFVRDAERDPSTCSFGKLHQLSIALGLNWGLQKNDQLIWPDRGLDNSSGEIMDIGLTSNKKQLAS